MTETIPEDLMQVARHVASYVRNKADAEAVENIVARVLIYQRTRQEERVRVLEEALGDLVSWLPDKPTEPEWRFKAGQYGADDAIAAARAALGNGSSNN